MAGSRSLFAIFCFVIQTAVRVRGGPEREAAGVLGGQADLAHAQRLHVSVE